jgi:hypothetical protein
VLAGLLLGACTDDSEGMADATADDQATFPLSCQDIVDACHEVDPGSGPIHDCHETAHDTATSEVCDPIRDECVGLCHAAADALADAEADGSGAEDADPDVSLIEDAAGDDGPAEADAVGCCDMSGVEDAHAHEH